MVFVGKEGLDLITAQEFATNAEFRSYMERGGNVDACFKGYGVTRQVARDARGIVLGETVKEDLEPDKEDKTPKHSITVRETENEYFVYVTGSRVQSREEAIEFYNIDTEKWDVVECTFVTQEQVSAPRAVGSSEEGWSRKDNRVRITQFCNVSIKCRPKAPVLVAAEKLVENILAKIDDHAPQYQPFPYIKIRKYSKMLEINIPDLHVGKMCWKPESGENYDLDIAVRLYHTAIEDLLSKTSHIEFDKILYVLGNDLMHTDGQNGTTFSGTRQDVDSRHQKIFLETQDMIVRSIERMMPIAPMEIVFVPGNHDTQSVFFMGQVIKSWFRNAKNVMVDNEPMSRKIKEWGNSMIGLTHGDKENITKLSMAMATQDRQMWGRTKYCEIQIGHWHKKALEGEEFGTRVRTLPSLAPADAWHFGNAYTNNVRSAEALVWDKETCFDGYFPHNVFS